MWIYVDDAWRLQSYNPNSMDGNTGWYETNDALFFPQTSDNNGEANPTDTLPDIELRGSRGIPLYRYDLAADTIIPRTQAEMEADYVPPVPAPSNDQRIADLEAAMTALEEGIASV